MRLKMQEFGLFLLQGIPEMVGITGLSLAIAGIPLRWGRILLAGTLLAILIYLIRLLPVTFGLHTVAGLLLLLFFIIKTTNAPTSWVLISVFTSFAILAVLEIAVHEAFFYVTKLNPQEVIDNYPLWIELGLTQSALLIFLAFLVTRVKQPQKEAWKV
jgi:hypothetical protein